MLDTSKALIERLSDLASDDSAFSVYRTQQAIELRRGCLSLPESRFICAHQTYEMAFEFAEMLALQSGLPLKDYRDL